MNKDFMKWFDDEVASFPRRASGEELYEHMAKLAEIAITEDSKSVVAVMTQWLQLRSEPKTMIAVDLAGKYRISELKGELESLLFDVVAGKAFKPFYERPIRKALAMI